jgi:hypothetical protein
MAQHADDVADVVVLEVVGGQCDEDALGSLADHVRRVSVVRFSSVIRQVRSARKDLICVLEASSSRIRVALPCDSGYLRATLVNEMFPCDNLLR